MITVRVDTSRARAKLAAVRAAGPRGRRAAVIEMTRGVLKNVEVIAPRDTNRYIRGWMQAGNAAGIGPFVVPTLNRASKEQHILAALVEQRNFWEFIVDRYHKQGRDDSWAHKAERKLAGAEEQIQKFMDSQGGAVIAMNLFSNYTKKGGRSIRLLNKIYGGTGSIIDEPGATFVRLHNREPHASVVEKRSRVIGRAGAMFRSSGLSKVKGKYLAEALAMISKGGAGMTVGR